MGRGKSGLSGNKGDMYELVVGKDSYIYDAKYQKAMSDSGKYFNEMDTAKRRVWELDDQLDKEVIPLEGLNRMYSKMLNSFTERGEEIKKELDQVRAQESEAEEKWHNANAILKSYDSVNREIQMATWKSPDIKIADKTDYRGFEMDTHTPYLQEHLRKGEAVIVEMSPREYLQRVAYDIFNKSTLETAVRGTIPANVRKYARMMRKGTKFYMPSLNYNDKEQEGRHRALAALLNGYKKIPVLIVPKRR